MSKLNQADLELYILTFGPHTYMSLCEHFVYVGGQAHADEQCRQIDRTLQKLRRKGKLMLTRSGKDQIWTAIKPPVAE